MTKKSEATNQETPPKKRRSPMLVAAASAQRHAKLTEQIDRAKERVAAWEAERAAIPGDLEPEALEVFRRMVGD